MENHANLLCTTGRSGTLRPNENASVSLAFSSPGSFIIEPFEDEIQTDICATALS